jgi:hypothetical protein
MLFDFLSMFNNYEERRVARFIKGKTICIDTCDVSDSDKPYETGVAHPSYNGGQIIVVELYDTKESALKGHNKWVKKMTSKNLPKELIDVSSAEVAKFCDVLDSSWREVKINK